VIVVLAVLVAACSGEASPFTTVTATPMTTVATTTTTSSTVTTTLPTIEACADIPYRPLVVPERVAGSDTDPADVGDDPYTTIPGTTIQLWVDVDSEPVMVLIRGSLPLESWAGPTARVEVVREDAALGPLSGDRWAVAWFESEDRCDLYTLVLYPPTSADEALEVAESLILDR
jgi:hypothetical protein